MQVNGLDPLLSVLGVLCSQVPHTVVYTYVQAALVKLVGLVRGREESDRSARFHCVISLTYFTTFSVVTGFPDDFY